MNRKLAVGGLHRLLRRSPVVVAFLCAVILAFVSFYNSNKLQNRHHGSSNMRQIYEPERFELGNRRFPSPAAAAAAAAGIDVEKRNSSMKSLKELVRDAVDRGLLVIVNASDTDAAHVLADHWHGSRLDISGALDGPMGEILVEVMQELRNMEDMALEVAELKRKIQRLEHQTKGASPLFPSHQSFPVRAHKIGESPFPLFLINNFQVRAIFTLELRK